MDVVYVIDPEGVVEQAGPASRVAVVAARRPEGSLLDDLREAVVADGYACILKHGSGCWTVMCAPAGGAAASKLAGLALKTLGASGLVALRYHVDQWYEELAPVPEAVRRLGYPLSLVAVEPAYAVEALPLTRVARDKMLGGLVRLWRLAGGDLDEAAPVLAELSATERSVVLEQDGDRAATVVEIGRGLRERDEVWTIGAEGWRVRVPGEPALEADLARSPVALEVGPAPAVELVQASFGRGDVTRRATFRRLVLPWHRARGRVMTVTTVPVSRRRR